MRERERERERLKKNWHEIRNMLNEDSKKRGECGENTERKCKTDVELVCSVCERCTRNICYFHACSQRLIAGQTGGESLHVKKVQSDTSSIF